MSAAAQRNAGLTLAPVRQVLLAERLLAAGTVQPVDSQVGRVRPLARGRLLEVLVRAGDRVTAGQPLARMDNLEAADLAAQLAAARAERDRLGILLAHQTSQTERHRRLVDLGAGVLRQLEQSRAEQEALAASVRSQESVIAGLQTRLKRLGGTETEAGVPAVTALTAPFPGVVLTAHASPGDVVEAGAEVFTVADLRRVWVQAGVYEKDLGHVRRGQAATVQIDTYPGRVFAGTVTYIADALDPQTRTAKVRCEVDNGAGLLKLDMFANVYLPTTFERNALAVPASAIQQVDGKSVVFIARAAEEFEVREVHTGRTVDDRVEIQAGLREGDRIVTLGAFHLKSILAGKGLGEE
jgi:cobalt-zinc-cadmium efflux system membrane fusion protein